MFKGFYCPEAKFYRLPNDWFDRWIDLRESAGRVRIFAPLKTMEYVIKWTWGHENFDRPVRIPRRTFRYGHRIGHQRLDRGTNLSTHGLEDGLDFLTERGLLVEHLVELEGDRPSRPAFLPRLRSDDSDAGFDRPDSGYFKVPDIWTDMTHSVTSEALILTVEYFFRHTWGWQGDGGEPRWLDPDEVTNGRRYRSASNGERYDRGIGYSERRVRDALRQGVQRGWLVWRCAEQGDGREYALHLAGMDVAADGRWVASTPEISPVQVETEAGAEKAPPVETGDAPVVQVSADTRMEFEIAQLRTQVAALTHLVQSLIGLLREAGIEAGIAVEAGAGADANAAHQVDANAPLHLDINAALLNTNAPGCLDVNAALEDTNASFGDTNAWPLGHKRTAYYTDTSQTLQTPPPPDTAAHATIEGDGDGRCEHGTGGGGGGGDHALSQSLQTHLMALDPPMSPEAASRTIAEHGAETVQAWLLVLENDPTVRSVAALLTHKLRNGETPPAIGGSKAPQPGCPWCGGTGEVVLAHVPQMDPDYGRAIPCPRCG